MYEFDDTRLEDPDALAAADHLLRPLAQAGSRLRREAESAADQLAGIPQGERLRAMIALGPEARLLRAVLEPTCPVPLVAWPRLGLPGWVGPLDLVVVLGGADEMASAAAYEATRRGSMLIAVCPSDSLVAQLSQGGASVLPTVTGDPFAAAVVALAALHRLGLGPVVDVQAVAAAMDEVAIASAAAIDATVNPGKKVALELAEVDPLVWGGSILAARASRRVAEALRRATGRIVLSADAASIQPLLSQVAPRDPFADPFDVAAGPRRRGLVLLDDGLGDEKAVEEQAMLQTQSASRDVLVSTLSQTQGTAIERYAAILQQGLFAAAYLRIGLGRSEDVIE